MSTVLVTGGSGFLGAHCILRLLTMGHAVRTTVRSLSRQVAVRTALEAAGVKSDADLHFIAADLRADSGWADAATDCEYVLHVASPFPQGTPKNEDELILPAREGTLRVLRAARDSGVRRVVLTSSFGAIGYGHATTDAPFDETSWTNTDFAGVQPYIKSKTLAEHAAWDFIEHEKGELELTVVNPVGIFGPVLGLPLSSSVTIVKLLMEGAMPGCPKLSFGVVDVRDVADLHIRAMTSPAARGERFIAVAGKSMSMLGVAQVLKSHFGAAASRVPTRQLPNWLVRLASLGKPELRQTLPELSKVRETTSEKAKRLLAWTPRSNEEAIISSANSLIELGLLG